MKTLFFCGLSYNCFEFCCFGGLIANTKEQITKTPSNTTLTSKNKTLLVLKSGPSLYKLAPQAI